jgi:hypothetical protein
MPMSGRFAPAWIACRTTVAKLQRDANYAMLLWSELRPVLRIPQGFGNELTMSCGSSAGGTVVA